MKKLIKTLPFLAIALTINISISCSQKSQMEILFNTSNNALIELYYSLNLLLVNNEPNPDQEQYGMSVAIDNNDNIIVAGSTYNGSSTDMAIWKYTRNGNPDTSFGTNGIVQYDGPASGYDSAFDVAIDNNNNIFVTGRTDNLTKSTMGVWKYDQNGIPDNSFGTGGVVTYDVGWGQAGESLAIDSSGNILVTGPCINATEDMAIWKFDSSGNLISNGTFPIFYDDGWDEYGESIILDASGNILVSGRSNDGTNPVMTIWRYDSAGNPDNTFGTGGIARFSDGNQHQSTSIEIDSYGRILSAGSIYDTLNFTRCPAIWRYTQNGTLDNSFGTNGLAIISANPFDSNSFSDIGIDISGKIFAVGYTQPNPMDSDMLIARYTAEGTLDTAFGTNGIVKDNNAAGGNGNDRATGIAVTSSGDFIVAGDSENANTDHDIAIWECLRI